MNIDVQNFVMPIFLKRDELSVNHTQRYSA